MKLVYFLWVLQMTLISYVLGKLIQSFWEEGPSWMCAGLGVLTLYLWYTRREVTRFYQLVWGKLRRRQTKGPESINLEGKD